MKYKYLLIIFIAGFIGRLLGAMLKVTHNRGAHEWMWASTGIMVFSLLLLIWKLLKNRDRNNFLNK
ncbi:MAG: hypothetical protein EOO06_04915 [Chitinophagaceae bacterium]|nr:MAG: hypothetical protein EOO06_04915 [Chitinophagaceae bacterium]